MVRVCVEFAILYLLMAILILAVSFAVEALFDYEMTFGGLGFVPILVAAMITGQRYGKREGALPPSGFAWGASVLMALTSTVVSVLLAGAILAAVDPGASAELSAIFSQLDVGIFSIVILVVLVIQVLLIRLFFGWGAKQAAKVMSEDLVNRF